ncbi:MAG: hypothetical protein J5806_08885 [Lentisphaeria bacterium]|nr:hypothetical protein [Lentisphaeria bacterium]
MNSWMFFSEKGSGDPGGIVRLLFQLGSQQRLSSEEWHEFLPASRESRQGHSLGFLCDGMSSFPRELSDLPFRPLKSDWIITPKCWTGTVNITIVPPGDVPGWSFHAEKAGSRVFTVMGTFADQVPCFRASGSYSFFPFPYVFPGTSDLFL